MTTQDRLKHRDIVVQLSGKMTEEIDAIFPIKGYEVAVHRGAGLNIDFCREPIGWTVTNAPSGYAFMSQIETLPKALLLVRFLVREHDKTELNGDLHKVHKDDSGAYKDTISAWRAHVTDGWFALPDGYDRKVYPQLIEARVMALEELKELKAYQRVPFLAKDGSIRELSINGTVKRWKREEDRVEFGIKYGLREYERWTAEDHSVLVTNG